MSTLTDRKIGQYLEGTSAENGGFDNMRQSRPHVDISKLFQPPDAKDVNISQNNTFDIV